METFSERLARSILESRLGRPEFAARSGVGTSALAKWLGGKLIPKSEQLHSLAKTAGVCMEWLLTGEEPKHPVFALWNRGFYLAYFARVETDVKCGEVACSSGETKLISAGIAKFEFFPPDHPDAISRDEQVRFYKRYVASSDEDKRKLLSLGPGTERFFTARCLNAFGIVMKRHLEKTG